MAKTVLTQTEIGLRSWILFSVLPAHLLKIIDILLKTSYFVNYKVNLKKMVM